MHRPDRLTFALVNCLLHSMHARTRTVRFLHCTLYLPYVLQWCERARYTKLRLAGRAWSSRLRVVLRVGIEDDARMSMCLMWRSPSCLVACYSLVRRAQLRARNAHVGGTAYCRATIRSYFKFRSLDARYSF